MRAVTGVLTTGSLLCLLHAAHANPVPSVLIGAWTDRPDCTPSGHLMVFSAHDVTIIEDNGRRSSAEISTTGTADDRLEIRILKRPAGVPPQAAGPKPGDRLVLRLVGGELHLLAQGDAKGMQDVKDAPRLHRCRP